MYKIFVNINNITMAVTSGFIDHEYRIDILYLKIGKKKKQ